MAWGKGYISLTGAGGAFGWALTDGQTPDRAALTVAGLRPGAMYEVIGDAGRMEIAADGAGSWRGVLSCGVPLCVFLLPQGDVALYNAGRMTLLAAQLLANRYQHEQNAPDDARPAALTPADQPANVPPFDEALYIAAQTVAALPDGMDIAADAPAAPIISEPAQPAAPIISEPAEPAAPVILREPSQAEPVDALPSLVWPKGTEGIKPYFGMYPPIALFDAPLWRFVRVPGQGAGVCCVGYRAENDRVTQTVHAVRARGGLIPPKGLQGYRYQRGMDGQGYWTLWRRV